MKRYMIHLGNSGFEFQTEHYINTKEFWEELSHDSYKFVAKTHRLAYGLKAIYRIGK